MKRFLYWLQRKKRVKEKHCGACCLNCKSEVATAFAVVENKFWWYDDVTYDYELGRSWQNEYK